MMTVTQAVCALLICYAAVGGVEGQSDPPAPPVPTGDCQLTGIEADIRCAHALLGEGGGDLLPHRIVAWGRVVVTLFSAAWSGLARCLGRVVSTLFPAA